MLSKGRERRKYHIPGFFISIYVFSDQDVFVLLSCSLPWVLSTHREISVQVIDSVLFMPFLPGQSSYFDFNLFSIFFSNYKVSTVIIWDFPFLRVSPEL